MPTKQFEPPKNKRPPTLKNVRSGKHKTSYSRTPLISIGKQWRQNIGSIVSSRAC